MRSDNCEAKMANTESRVSADQDIRCCDLAGEVVTLNVNTGKYYSLDQVGARMWTLLTQSGRVSTAYRTLLDEYDVAEEQLQQDLMSLVDELVAHGLLRIDPT